jgi:class 3 adenylate cyclase
MMGISIRTFITVPFLVLTFTPAALITWISYTNNQRTVEAIADDLVNQAANRIQERLEVYLATPRFINQFNVSAFESGELQLGNSEQLEQHFLRQLLSAFPDTHHSVTSTLNLKADNDLKRAINHIYVGTEAGTFFGAEHRQRQENQADSPWIIATSRADSTTNNRLLQYEWVSSAPTDSTDSTESTESTSEPISEPKPKNWKRTDVPVTKQLLDPEQAVNKQPYDPRLRPWYVKAKAVAENQGSLIGWSDVYCDRTTETPVITATQPIFIDGELQGVVGSDFLFSDIQAFLMDLIDELALGQEGQIFILNDAGYLLISSDLQVGQCEPNSTLPLRKATDLNDVAIRSVVQQHQKLQRKDQATTPQHDGLDSYQGFFWKSQPFSDAYGLNWALYIVIPESRFLETLEENNRTTFLFCILAASVSTILSFFVSQRIVNPVLKLEKATKELADAVIEGKKVDRVYIDENPSELHELARTFAIVSGQLRDSFLAFSHFVPANFLSILGHKNPTEFRTKMCLEKEMTILFSDIRSFTLLSDQMDPSDSFKLVDQYFEAMEPAIDAEGGFIDKFIGDAIMALFEGEDSADRALKAAIGMLANLQQFNATRQDHARHDVAGHDASASPKSVLNVPLNIGIGIHKGKITMGTLGGKSRWDTTVIGSHVNRASRVEGLTKEFQASLLISGSTLAGVSDDLKQQYPHRYLGATQVRGVTEMVDIYEVYAADPRDLKLAKTRYSAEFQQALVSYQQEDYAGAYQQFSQLLAKVPEDGAVAFYLRKCESQRI